MSEPEPPALLPRPLLHFVAPGWLNDPNGLRATRDGWRIWFQYRDDAPAFRRVHWGTATSRDLLHWQFDGIALPGHDGLGAYSGCVLGAAPGTEACVAVFTRHRETPDGGRHEAQHLATSADGRRFLVHERAVLDEGRADFRDPFVFWHRGAWRMVLALPAPWQPTPGAAASSLSFHGADPPEDGSVPRHWARLGEFGPAECGRELWEVPWLLELEGTDGRTRAVLGLSVVDRRDDAARGSTRCWIGWFDGASFEAEPGWDGAPLDHGPDFYAAVPVDLPHPPGGAGPPRRCATLLAWMSNWHYARRVRGDGWAGGPLALPRLLELAVDGSGPVLRQRPAPQLEGRRVDAVATGSLQPVAGTGASLRLPGPACDLGLVVELRQGAQRLCLALHGGTLRLLLEQGGAVLRLERDAAPGVPGSEGAWSVRRREPSPRLALRAVLDACSVEVFADDGAACFTALAFPPSASAPGVVPMLHATVDGGSATLRYELVALAAGPVADADAGGHGGVGMGTAGDDRA
ncbi:MAG: glycoside hydrolase family 32 protein [Steroidobacteraceae bacterium]|jgi:sucrose-6-phosphate hydrolase SacC (GH32 family)|nr:glycoside hydrolase family 32 protein [Steroidobacteraceae bacterium]